jgi:hypothetical protein
MTPDTGKIAAIAGNDGASAQALLTEMAAQWRAGEAKIVGVTAEGHGLPGRTCGAGFLREIASGRAHTIYLDAPPSDTSCHLDAAGVLDAGLAIIEQIPTSDLVVLNKFGKLEATVRASRRHLQRLLPPTNRCSPLCRKSIATYGPTLRLAPSF